MLSRNKIPIIASSDIINLDLFKLWDRNRYSRTAGLSVFIRYLPKTFFAFFNLKPHREMTRPVYMELVQQNKNLGLKHSERFLTKLNRLRGMKICPW